MTYELKYDSTSISPMQTFGVFTNYLLPLVDSETADTLTVRILDSSGDSLHLNIALDLTTSGRYSETWFEERFEEFVRRIGGLTSDVKIANLMSFAQTLQTLIDRDMVQNKHLQASRVLDELVKIPHAVSTAHLRIQILDILTRYLDLSVQKTVTANTRHLQAEADADTTDPNSDAVDEESNRDKLLDQTRYILENQIQYLQFESMEPLFTITTYLELDAKPISEALSSFEVNSVEFVAEKGALYFARD
jgi:hypothetical protein